ncbi:MULTISPECIES: RNA-directed DNA polymerase [Pseudanabaena]|uniref:RNA-directed DNA polymerase (Reverse transcriptase) n=2 Tax=Pseudanabaena TaxID=1152 RepID=L8N334_9CYAN|nr:MULTISPECIES: RNA-directed DNA polymerase [Pseudanabaena]ELS33489.1 RNA-directed DNA polymerase (Reverse transcriptase) [Pseudanabaena biceps PCC 7429]MDG3494297.1 RNA-directed DNA polymerase [Pseudanabaena catenata USMAC16]
MKRHGNLYSQIINFENLLLAARKAQKGKRYRENVLVFNFHLESELLQLQTELLHQTYQPQSYRTFQIHEPKSRLISAAPYRDRVVHHALCNIIAPLIESSFIPDSYSNRIGYGTHRAIRRFTHFVRSSEYVFQCDIQKYFPSIDRQILKNILRQKLKCPQTLWLIDLIIDNSNDQIPVFDYFTGDDLLNPITRHRGLPIGNLTSQFFANVYLNNFDHFVKEQLKIKKYIRYVDDFAFFSNSRSELYQVRHTIEKYLASLRLKIHPIKSQIFTTKQGANFLGFRIFPTHIRVRSNNLRIGKRRIRLLRQAVFIGKISAPVAYLTILSWFAHLAHGDTWKLRSNLLFV